MEKNFAFVYSFGEELSLDEAGRIQLSKDKSEEGDKTSSQAKGGEDDEEE
jgi:hypothetical protein